MRINTKKVEYKTTIIVLSLIVVLILLIGGKLASPLPPTLPVGPDRPIDPSELKGEKGLVVRYLPEEEVVDSGLELVNADELKVYKPPEGYRLLFGLRDKKGTLYILYADEKYEKHKVAVVSGDKIEIKDVRFTTIKEYTCRKERHTQTIRYNNGTVREFVGEKTCFYRVEALDYNPLSSLRRVYVDCYYTVRLGGTNLATVHARGYIYYIYGDKITGITDLSYEWHQPYVTRCRFSHRASGVGTVVATIRAEGHYMLCYAGLSSTHWTQYAVVAVDVWGLIDCEGHHNAWAEIGCNC